MHMLSAICPALLCCVQTKASSARAELGKRLQVSGVAQARDFQPDSSMSSVQHFPPCTCELPVTLPAVAAWVRVSAVLCCAAHVEAVQTKRLQIAQLVCM
jgi:hypothetical protein